MVYGALLLFLLLLVVLHAIGTLFDLQYKVIRVSESGSLKVFVTWRLRKVSNSDPFSKVEIS